MAQILNFKHSKIKQMAEPYLYVMEQACKNVLLVQFQMNETFWPKLANSSTCKMQVPSMSNSQNNLLVQTQLWWDFNHIQSTVQIWAWELMQDKMRQT